MKIVREEIVGPIATIIKFKTEEGALFTRPLIAILVGNNNTVFRVVIEVANDTTYGLACSVFSENGNCAIRVAHALEAGTAWVCRVPCQRRR